MGEEKLPSFPEPLVLNEEKESASAKRVDSKKHIEAVGHRIWERRKSNIVSFRTKREQGIKER